MKIMAHALRTFRIDTLPSMKVAAIQGNCVPAKIAFAIVVDDIGQVSSMQREMRC